MVSLVVRRTIRATAQRLFDGWTQPAHLKNWWGPPGVDCIDAQVDLRVGGRYRLANRFPDGTVVWISGEFETIDPPRCLVYTWGLEPHVSASERVTVRFKPRGDLTEVIVLHERISDEAVRNMHEKGWEGCLDGLQEYQERVGP